MNFKSKNQKQLENTISFINLCILSIGPSKIKIFPILTELNNNSDKYNAMTLKEFKKL